MLRKAIFLFSILLASCIATPAGDNNPSVSIDNTRSRAKEAQAFCKARSYNTDFCILVDMSLHSGVKRFFVWSFQADSITHRFMVGHGCCDYPWSMDASRDRPTFSNKDGSHCSSLGKYRIGARGYSDWGIRIKYLMHGLEVSNSNALARNIVLHSWDEVPDREVYPAGTAEGWGCPTLSNNSMRLLDAKLKSATGPVLMWMYN